ncbi:MAG TPA: hypothetical protein VFG05_11785 [Methylocella sp.]|nr:hypothetical protein [Methylocella sp.]
MAHRIWLFLLAFTPLAATSPAQAGGLPQRIGECAGTRIKEVSTRLTDGATGKPVPGSGSAVSFENGGYQVSYDTVPALEQSRAGDPVRMCLVAIPKNCPKGDDRGRQYKTTNLRTHKSWTLRDSQHLCGGA